MALDLGRQPLLLRGLYAVIYARSFYLRCQVILIHRCRSITAQKESMQKNCPWNFNNLVQRRHFTRGERVNVSEHEFDGLSIGTEIGRLSSFANKQSSDKYITQSTCVSDRYYLPQMLMVKYQQWFCPSKQKLRTSSGWMQGPVHTFTNRLYHFLPSTIQCFVHRLLFNCLHQSRQCGYDSFTATILQLLLHISSFCSSTSYKVVQLMTRAASLYRNTWYRERMPPQTLPQCCVGLDS